MTAAAIAFHLLSVPVAYLYTVFLEWFIHRYLFHGLGKKKDSRFRFHYYDHHRAARKHAGYDPAFIDAPWSWNASGREVWALLVGSILHLPIALVAPLGWLTAVLCGMNYHRMHKKSHVDPEWCRTHLPWHWDHHMGSVSEANWCVTNEWFDKLMGTRVELPECRAPKAALPPPEPEEAEAAAL